MKHILTRLVLLFFLCNAYEGYSFTGKRTTLIPRSQTTNAQRSLVGWYDIINRYHWDDKQYWGWSIGGAYNRTSDSAEIESFLFGRKQFEVVGSRVAGRSDKALLADYFGLPSDFQGSICFAPTISTFTADFAWFWRLDHIIDGWYFRAHAPVVHTTWDLNTKEKVSVAGTLGFPGGYMGSTVIARSALPTTLKQVMDNTLEAVTFGDMQDPIAYGRVFECKVHTHISDVHIETGYAPYTSKTGHLALGIRVGVPSGTRPSQRTIFSPIAGNGHHAECGASLTWHMVPWMNEQETSYFGIYSDLYITHLFKDTQPKSYDFIDQKAGSRYILLERFFEPGNTGVYVAGSQITQQYQGRLIPAINATTLCSSVSFPVQLDWALMFAYHRDCGLDVNWGYGLWIRSAEKLHCRERFPDNTFAIKGDAQIYGFDMGNTAYKLSATQSKATIFGGQNDGNFVTDLYANNNADNAMNAQDSGAMPLYQLNATDAGTFGITQANVKTSYPAKLLSDADINNDSALMPRSLTHKLFISVGRFWRKYEKMPFLTIGAEIEWHCKCLENNGALSQWGVWIKGGFTV